MKMKITTKHTHPITTLDSRVPGDVFTFPETPNSYYIIVEPDYELDEGAGVYCVDLETGELFRYDEFKEIIPVVFEATASF